MRLTAPAGPNYPSFRFHCHYQDTLSTCGCFPAVRANLLKHDLQLTAEQITGLRRILDLLCMGNVSIPRLAILIHDPEKLLERVAYVVCSVLASRHN